MTVIVTGATSFIGRAAVKKLLVNGENVLAVSRPASAGAGALQELFKDLKSRQSKKERALEIWNFAFVSWERLKNWKKFTIKRNCRQKHGFI